MPKKAKKAKKAKKPEPDAIYKALAAEWEQRRKAQDHGGGEWLVERAELPVDPLPFLQTLRRLAYLAQDDLFIEAHSALMRSDLIDAATGKWSLSGTEIRRVLPQLIEDAIAADTTERQAIAEAVAVFELYPDAQNFDAAWKRLERLLHEWRKSVRQEPA